MQYLLLLRLILLLKKDRKSKVIETLIFLNFTNLENFLNSI